MRQRYVYIIKDGGKVRAVETRARTARKTLDVLRTAKVAQLPQPDEMVIPYGEYMRQYAALMDSWTLERWPIGPPHSYTDEST